MREGSVSAIILACASLALALVGLSCPACPATDGPCVSTSDCPADQVCVEERCRSVCNSSVDCDEDQACVQGACLSRDTECERSDDCGSGQRCVRGSCQVADGGGGADAAGREDAAGRDAAQEDGAGVDSASQDSGAPDPCLGDPCAAPTECRPDGSGGYSCVCGERACVPGEQCFTPVPEDVITSPRCCPTDWVNCADVCRDVRVDPGHCGGCGVPCAGGETCESGVCQCEAQACDPLTQDCCEGACYDVLTDSTHCGQVGTGEGCVQACGQDESCILGRCSCSLDADCPAEWACCDQSYCANLANDVNNCGACHEVCAPGEVCESSHCKCADGCDDGEACTEDSCVAGRCQHATLDQDDDGYCHSSCPDSASGGIGDCIDGDCDDTDPALRPSAVELCDGRDNDCDAATLDGAADCPGLCCGEPAACSACCDDATVCGTGEWSCAAGSCACRGTVCGALCSSTAECCEASDCGSGDWGCAELTCDCDGAICGERCYASGACCDAPNACGGCAMLSAAPGSLCGTCGSYQCDGVDAVVCSGDVALDGGWSSWSYSAWTPSGSCGQYVSCKQRETRDGTRTCSDPAPACGGADCVGSSSTTETRDTLDCGTVNGGWTDWSYTAWTDVGSCHQYTECRQRETRDGTRTCTNPAPACGGSACTGDTTTTETRHTEICGVGDDCGGTYCVDIRFRHQTCGAGGACGNSRVIEVCDTNETCDATSGCVCGNSGENCAGTSADFCCLNNTDGCYDVDNNNNHCGTGCAVCGVHSSCSSGACSCVTDWGDCDPGTAGCETDLTTPINCGGCNNDCIGEIDGEACVYTGFWRCGCEDDGDCPSHNFICYQQFNFCEPEEPY